MAKKRDMDSIRREQAREAEKRASGRSPEKPPSTATPPKPPTEQELREASELMQGEFDAQVSRWHGARPAPEPGAPADLENAAGKASDLEKPAAAGEAMPMPAAPAPPSPSSPPDLNALGATAGAGSSGAPGSSGADGQELLEAILSTLKEMNTRLGNIEADMSIVTEGY